MLRRCRAAGAGCRTGASAADPTTTKDRGTRKRMRVRLPRKMRVLFVCHSNRKRSATAERIFAKDPGHDVRSAGTSADALVRVNQRMLDWAAIIFTMDNEQPRTLEKIFP